MEDTLLLGPKKKGQLFVISAPAGTGKTTLVTMLLKEFPERVVRSVTCTTRIPRKGEINGKDYYFLSEEEFENLVKKKQFLEHTVVFGKRYGTLKREVQKLKRQGKIVALVIDTQGAALLKEKINDASFIFIAPPSIEALERRLLKRKTETEKERKRRLSWAKHEIKQSIWYDYLLVNKDLNQAYQILKSIIIAEGHRLK